MTKYTFLTRDRILQNAQKLIDMAKKTAPDVCNYFVYQGVLHLCLGNVSAAEDSFNTALQKDDASLHANLGVIKVRLFHILTI
jgi:lipoprotein NlpI